jgi:coatomer subunit beta
VSFKRLRSTPLAPPNLTTADHPPQQSWTLPAPKTSRAMNCTLLIHSRKLAVKGEQPPTQDELCKMLENKDDNIKIEGAKKSILMLLNGEKLPRLPMTVIRFCINTKDKMLKKLIMLYWEVVEKFDSEGKLKPEMILVW